MPFKLDAIDAEVRAFGSSLWQGIRSTAGWLERHLGSLILLQLVLALLIGLLIYPHDESWLKALRAGKQAHSFLSSLARWLSYLGDFAFFNLAIVVALLIAARKTQQAHWRRLATVCLLSSMLSGISAVSLRFMLGRARPSAHAGGGFYGPDFRSEYQGCPSGHSATAFGAAVPLVIAQPLVGVPLLGIAGGVGWSRMYLNKHFPTDVAAGLWMALWCGIPLGIVARRRKG